MGGWGAIGSRRVGSWAAPGANGEADGGACGLCDHREPLKARPAGDDMDGFGLPLAAIARIAVSPRPPTHPPTHPSPGSVGRRRSFGLCRLLLFAGRRSKPGRGVVGVVRSWPFWPISGLGTAEQQVAPTATQLHWYCWVRQSKACVNLPLALE